MADQEAPRDTGATSSKVVFVDRPVLCRIAWKASALQVMAAWALESPASPSVRDLVFMLLVCIGRDV